MSTLYPSSLSDAEWDCLQQALPIRPPCSRLRRHSLRSVLDALFYLLRTGLWTRLYRTLRGAERRRVGKDPDPSAAIIDAQSVKTVEESGRICGDDAHKCVKGRKHHLLVDTLGLPPPHLCHAGQCA
jgi:putative transposase